MLKAGTEKLLSVGTQLIESVNERLFRDLTEYILKERISQLLVCHASLFRPLIWRGIGYK